MPNTRYITMPRRSREEIACFWIRHAAISRSKHNLLTRTPEPEGSPMNPILVAVEGPLKGTVLLLDQPDVSVGRERSNTLALDDPAMSRHHFTIHREGDRFTLTDHKS